MFASFLNSLEIAVRSVLAWSTLVKQPIVPSAQPHVFWLSLITGALPNQLA